MVDRLTMSACAGQRTSGEASGWVWRSSSRTDWNHGHGCSHGVGASQPKQQGSTVQLMNIISSPVPLRACGAQLGAAAQLEHATRPDSPPKRGVGTYMGHPRLKSAAVARKSRASARSFAGELSCSNFRPHHVTITQLVCLSVPHLKCSCLSWLLGTHAHNRRLPLNMLHQVPEEHSS